MDIPRILTIVLLIVVLLPLLALLIYKIKYRSNVGKYSEHQVQVKLNKYISKIGGFIISNVIIPIDKDKTIDIDYILFTNYGVFIIKSKKIPGSIIGNEEENNWLQVLGVDGKVRNMLHNPVIENKINVEAVNKILNIKDIYNLVVFTMNNTRKINSTHVYKRGELIKCLKSYSNKVFSDREVVHLYEKIMYYKEHPITSK